MNLTIMHYKFVSKARQSRRWDDTTKIYRDLLMKDVKKQIFDFKDFKELGMSLGRDPKMLFIAVQLTNFASSLCQPSLDSNQTLATGKPKDPIWRPAS